MLKAVADWARWFEVTPVGKALFWAVAVWMCFIAEFVLYLARRNPDAASFGADTMLWLMQWVFLISGALAGLLALCFLGQCLVLLCVAPRRLLKSG